MLNFARLPMLTLSELFPAITYDHAAILQHLWFKSYAQQHPPARRLIDGFEYALFAHTRILHDVHWLSVRSISSIKRRLADLYSWGAVFHRSLPRQGNPSLSDLWLHVPPAVAALFARPASVPAENGVQFDPRFTPKRGSIWTTLELKQYAEAPQAPRTPPWIGPPRLYGRPKYTANYTNTPAVRHLEGN